MGFFWITRYPQKSRVQSLASSEADQDHEAGYGHQQGRVRQQIDVLRDADRRKLAAVNTEPPPRSRAGSPSPT